MQLVTPQFYVNRVPVRSANRDIGNNAQPLAANSFQDQFQATQPKFGFFGTRSPEQRRDHWITKLNRLEKELGDGRRLEIPVRKPEVSDRELKRAVDDLDRIISGFDALAKAHPDVMFMIPTLRVRALVDSAFVQHHLGNNDVAPESMKFAQEALRELEQDPKVKLSLDEVLELKCAMIAFYRDIGYIRQAVELTAEFLGSGSPSIAQIEGEFQPYLDMLRRKRDNDGLLLIRQTQLNLVLCAIDKSVFPVTREGSTESQPVSGSISEALEKSSVRSREAAEYRHKVWADFAAVLLSHMADLHRDLGDRAAEARCREEAMQLGENWRLKLEA